MSTKPEEDARIVHIGATVPQLATMFNMSQKSVTQRLIGRVSPAVIKGATDKDSIRYHLRDAAPLLCDPKVDIEEILKTLTPAKLPPMLQDVFWKGQKSRLEVEQMLGNLWDTERVVQVLGEAFKPCRMAILMFKEEIEQQEELSPSTRALLDTMSDSLLTGLHTALVEAFKDYVPAEHEHGMPLGHETTVTIESDVAFEESAGDGFDD